MSILNIPVVAFEGMPKSGKTTIARKLVKRSKKRILFEEIYFSSSQLDQLEDKRGMLSESKWFIDQEVARGRGLNNINAAALDLIIVDRMYLSTLAYCYARSKINYNPKEFEQLVNYFLVNQDNFIKYDSIIVFDNSVELTILKREQEKLEEDKKYWLNKKFMEYYKDFYKTMMFRYVKSKITTINVEKLSLGEIYEKILLLILPN